MASQIIVSNGLKTLGRQIAKNAPRILTFAGVAGVIMTGAFAAKAALESSEILKYKKEEKRKIFIDQNLKAGLYDKEEDIPQILIDDATKLTAGEVLKLTWKHWIMPVSSGLATIGCNLGSDRLNYVRHASAISALEASKKVYNEYIAKNAELNGENEHKKVLDEISKDHIQNAEIVEDKIYNNGAGSTLIRCAYDGRMFYGDIDKIEKVAKEMAREIDAYQNDIGEMFISLNEFLNDCGVYDDTIAGKDNGFGPGNNIYVDWGSCYREDLRQAVLELRFLNDPVPRYSF